jgi:hypothetical protein
MRKEKRDIYLFSNKTSSSHKHELMKIGTKYDMWHSWGDVVQIRRLQERSM